MTDFATMRVSCKLCHWVAEDEPEKALARQRRHRERRHGISHGRRRRTGRSMKTAYTELSPEQRLEIEQDIARRKRLHGINQEEAA